MDRPPLHLFISIVLVVVIGMFVIPTVAIKALRFSPTWEELKGKEKSGGQAIQYRR